MFNLFVLALFAAQALLVRADPNPTAPGPGAVFNEGSTCRTDWTIDPTGVWTKMTIQLMTGDNFNMIALTTLATVDATTQSTYSFPCPQVTPNSAIYFYQYKSPSSTNTYWSTRFAIADAAGATTPPPNTTQPNGAQIPWGVGALLGTGGSSPAAPPSSSTPSSSSPSSISPTSPSSSPVLPVSVTSSSLVSPTSPTGSILASIPGSSQITTNAAPVPSTTGVGPTTSSGTSSVFSGQTAMGAIAVITVVFMIIF